MRETRMVLAVVTAMGMSACEMVREGLPAEEPLPAQVPLPPPASVAVPLEAPPPPLAVPEGHSRMFFEDFEHGLARWYAMSGKWKVREVKPGVRAYGADARQFALSYGSGTANWSNYRVGARITLVDDRAGPVGLVGRGQGDHHYFELVVGPDGQGDRSWSIRERIAHKWTTLATGPFAFVPGQPFELYLALRGSLLEAAVAAPGGPATVLGQGTIGPGRWPHGRFGMVSDGGVAQFDDVTVTADGTLLDFNADWTPIAELRDPSSFFPGGPPGGWYVTPIHATLRASDGKVLITGFGRKEDASSDGCDDSSSNTNHRETGHTWLLTPSDLDALTDDGVFPVTPINEQNLDNTDVLYCAGHTTLADGRIFFAAGTRYVGRLPDYSAERGLRYGRVYTPAGGGGAFTRISAKFNGGQSASYPGSDGGTVQGEKWYPTNLLLGDGRVLTFGGFHYSSGGPGSKPNLSLELFDPKVWDLNPSNNPYTVLTQHGDGQPDTPPTRGYTNLFQLPKPVPAGSAGGLARSVALAGGRGRMFLFNHEPGPSGAARLFTGALTPSPDGTPTNERGEGSSGVLLFDGRIAFTNGGHTGAGSRNVYFYDPYANSWSGTPQLDTTISRMYGDAVQLPDGKIMIINGYNNNLTEPGNTNDIPGSSGLTTRPVLIDPYQTPATAAPQTAWPEPTHRGYHAIALLLKDGRILVGGGKDASHETGCEKAEMRIYVPPYLQGNPTRPTIDNISQGQQIQVGSAPFAISYSGTLKSVRGVALLAPGSITHGFDSGQRYVPLTVVSGGGASGSVTVRPPTNINIAQPGDYLLFVINSAGVPSQGVHVRLTPPPACVFPVDGSSASVQNYLEAEDPSRRDGPFVEVAGPVSGGAYIQVTPGTSHTAVPDEGKVMWYDLDVTSGGSFKIWAHINGPNTSSNSFWASADGNADVQLSIPTFGAWGWVTSTTLLSFPTGKHTLKVKVREAGALIDKIMLTESTSTTPPSGFAQPVVVCPGGNPPNAPVNLVAADGAGAATLTWMDGGGGTTFYKIERKPQGQPDSMFMQIGTSPTPGFTDPAAPGSYTYRVRASNANGDSPYSNSDDATITPAMGPPPPSSARTSALTGTSIRLQWNDNSSNETGFRIEKKVGAGSFTPLTTTAANVTTHDDTGLAAGSFTYRVIAAGTPDSAPSNEAVAVIVLPEADTYVRNNGTGPFGTGTVIDVKTTTTTTTQRNGFLRFPLAAVPAAVPVAKLLLFGHAATTAKTTNVHAVDDIGWAESIVWSSQPPTGASITGVSVATSDAWHLWTLTAHIQGKKNASASAVSLGVRSGVTSDEGQTTFNSREGTSKPALVITTN